MYLPSTVQDLIKETEITRSRNYWKRWTGEAFYSCSEYKIICIYFQIHIGLKNSFSFSVFFRVPPWSKASLISIFYQMCPPEGNPTRATYWWLILLIILLFFKYKALCLKQDIERASFWWFKSSIILILQRCQLFTDNHLQFRLWDLNKIKRWSKHKETV